MTIAGLVILFSAIIFLEAPDLVREGKWKEFAVFGVLILLSMFLSFGLALNLPLPNPIGALEAVFTPITQYMDNLVTQ